ncbi:unnamed protein product [Ixodes persulcatus]
MTSPQLLSKKQTTCPPHRTVVQGRPQRVSAYCPLWDVLEVWPRLKVATQGLRTARAEASFERMAGSTRYMHQYYRFPYGVFAAPAYFFYFFLICKGSTVCLSPLACSQNFKLTLS